MPQPPAILTGRLHALEVDDTGHYAYIYNGDNKPYRFQVSEDCHRRIKLAYSDYLVYRDFVGAYEYRSYSVNAQIEQDWGAELVEQIAVTETEQAFLAGTR